MRRFLAFVLLAAAFPALAQGVDAMSSILLVAKKDMRDPFFRDTVVLVSHRLGPNPVGIIINRPTNESVTTSVPMAKERPAKEVVYYGGPVGVADLTAVFRAENAPKDAVEILEGVYLTMRRADMNDVLARRPAVKDLRFFAGYAGWARGQLEAEVARGDWHLVRASASAIFEKNPATLWRDLERRASAKQTSLTLP